MKVSFKTVMLVIVAAIMLIGAIPLSGALAAGYTWQPVGNSGFSSGEAQYISIVCDSSNVLWAAYADVSNGSKVTVKKFIDNEWTTVKNGDNEAISDGAATNISLVVGRDNNLYIVYTDGGTTVKVKKYENNAWTDLGSPNLSERFGAIAVTSSGKIYAVCTHDYNMNVYTYEGGTWNLNFGQGASDSLHSFPTAGMTSDDRLYLSYCRRGIHVITYSGTGIYDFVDGVGIEGTAQYAKMAIGSDSLPRIAFQGGPGFGYKALVRQCTTNYGSFIGGSGGFSAGIATYTSIVLDSNNTPYVAYIDEGVNNKAVVKKHTSTGWVSVGPEGISPGSANYTSIAIDGNGIIYLAYQDGSNENRITVNRLTQAATVTFESNGGDTILPMTVVVNSLIQKPTTPNKKGYTFDAWYEDPELTTPFDFDKTRITDDKTLYAKWTPINYSVNVGSLTGGSITADPQTAIIGTTINLTITPGTGMRFRPSTLKYYDGTEYVHIIGNSFTMPAADITITGDFVAQGNYFDLTLATPTVTGSLYTEGSINISTIVSNLGNADSPKSTLSFILVTESGNVTLGQGKSLSKIKPGKAKTIKYKATLPFGLPSDVYSIRVVVTPAAGEDDNPDNNSVQQDVTIAAPDLSVDSVTVLGTLTPGKSTNVNVDINNANNALAKKFNVKFYLSTSNGFDFNNPPSICLGTKKVSKQAQGTTTLKMKAKVPKGFVFEPGTDYYVIAAVDSDRVIFEDYENNNFKSVKI
ncbi:MAG: InlB B-repeat-containing protein [Chitinophagales bacterium]